MNRSHPFHFNLRLLPTPIKWTLFATAITGLFSFFSHSLCTQVLGMPSLQQFLSLSLWGLRRCFFWQWLSYLFVLPLPSHKITLDLLFHLFFNLFLLGSIGSSLIHWKKARHFIGLYFGGGLFVGWVSSLFFLLSGSPLPLAGATPSIYILLMAWAFLFPNAPFMLFFAIPIKARWLIFAMIGMNLFLNFSNGQFLSFLSTLAALFYGYFYPIFVWEMVGPFSRLHYFERQLIFYKKKFKIYLQCKKKTEICDPKIYNIKEEEP